MEGSICISFVCRLHLHLAPWVWGRYIFRLYAQCFYSNMNIQLWTGYSLSFGVWECMQIIPQYRLIGLFQNPSYKSVFMDVLKVSTTLGIQLPFFSVYYQHNGQREDLKRVTYMLLGFKRCGSKVHRQDGSKPWTMKSLAGPASPYRICDSISPRCPLKPVQPVVPGRDWVTSRLCLKRQMLENTSSCCPKSLKDGRCQSLRQEPSQEASPKVALPPSTTQRGRSLL